MTQILTLACLALSLLAPADTAPQSGIRPLIEAGHYKQASPLVDARLRKNPKDAEALYFLSMIKARAGDLDAAIALVEQVLALDGGTSEYHERLAELNGTKAMRVGMFSAMKFARGIKREAEMALQLDPKSSDAYEMLIQYYLQAPGIVGGDKNRGYQMLDKLFQMDAERANLIRADLSQKDKDDAKTEEYLKNAVRANPRSFDAVSRLAGWYVNHKNYEMGEKTSRDMLKIWPDRGTGYILLAIQYAGQERWQDLDAIVAESEKNDSDNLAPQYQAARILFTNGKDLPRAERYLRKYLTQDPELGSATWAYAHWRLGLVLEKQGRKPEAIKELQTALSLKPDMEEAKKDLARMK